MHNLCFLMMKQLLLSVFNLCCRLCSAYERKAFLDGIQYGANLIMELIETKKLE